MGEGTARPSKRGVLSLTGVLTSCVIILLCFTTTVETQNGFELESLGLMDMGSLSISDFSQSQSSLHFNDRLPCVFRGAIKYHKDVWIVDACTECTCTNGTTDCRIITCPTPKCPDPVSIDKECCALCPYTMEFYDIHTSFAPGQKITEGKTNHRFKFEPSVEVFKGRTSRRIRGENMWRLDGWVSRNDDGSGPMFSYQENIFSEKQRATEFKKSKDVYDPPKGLYWAFKKVKYTFDASEGLCEDFRYFCIKFNTTDALRPKFDLSFTYTVFGEENHRQIECVRLGRCEGVFAESFDWELTGEDPIPGQETPVTVDIDVIFKEDTRDLDGDGLWRVALFGSSNPTGDGPRFGEVAQILDDDESSTDISGGAPLEVDGIQTDFEIGTVGCINDVDYVCMEFLKGDAPDPDFTLITAGARGDQTRDTLITCKPQECQSRVVFTELEATLLSPDIIVEETDDTDTKVKLKATTDKDLTTTVAGEQLWQVKTFFSQNANGGGARIKEQPQILTRTQDDQRLNTGEDLVFKEMDFQVDLDTLICSEVPYMCFELAKNPSSSIDYTFETQPLQDPFVDCISMEDVCKGVVFTELDWSREVPEDHVPGTDSPITLEATVDVEPYSRQVTGVDLWKVSVFASRDESGNARLEPLFADVLTPVDAAITLPQGGPLTFPMLETPPFNVDKMGCGDFRYLCVEFQKGASPLPDYTYETSTGADTIVKCKPEDCAERKQIILGCKVHMKRTWKLVEKKGGDYCSCADYRSIV